MTDDLGAGGLRLERHGPVAWCVIARPWDGSSPSAQFVSAQKLYSVVSMPPRGTLKTVPPVESVPSPLAPPWAVVPYKSPLAAWTKPLSGPKPSVHPVSAQKLYSVVSVPLSVILKTVPPFPFAPPKEVVPYKSPLVAWTRLALGS